MGGYLQKEGFRFFFLHLWILKGTLILSARIGSISSRNQPISLAGFWLNLLFIEHRGEEG